MRYARELVSQKGRRLMPRDISVRLDDATYRAFSSLADARNITVANYVRELVSEEIISVLSKLPEGSETSNVLESNSHLLPSEVEEKLFNLGLGRSDFDNFKRYADDEFGGNYDAAIAKLSEKNSPGGFLNWYNKK